MTGFPYELRRLETIAEYEACVALQRETWGSDFADVVPVSILKVSQRIGGVTAGAFDGQGDLAGIVFGMTGTEGGRLVHWSDLLAVRKDLRESGLGFRLKLYQRDLLLPLGVETVYWTYDPLEARNAHLNFNKLGVEVSEYVEDMYGDTASALHEGLGTDRFVVAWRIGSERVGRIVGGEAPVVDVVFADAPVVNTMGSGGGVEAGALIESREPCVRVEIPADIQEVKRGAGRMGEAWRLSTREAFGHYLALGYAVKSFRREADGRCFYHLRRE